MKVYRLSDATVYDRINTIYQFIKPFLGLKNMYIWRNMEPLMRNLFFFIFMEKYYAKIIIKQSSLTSPLFLMLLS